MNKEQFYAALLNPQLLDISTLADVTELAAEFPFFETGRMLLLKNLHAVGNVRFRGELKRGAIHVSNRNALYKLINFVPTKEPEPIVEQIVTETPPTAQTAPVEYFADVADDLSETIEFTQSPTSTYTLEDEPITIASDEKCSFSQWLDYVNNSAAPDEKPTTPAERSSQLIDSFLNSDHKHIAQSAPLSDDEIRRRVDDSTRENDSILTETLAGIYISQKQYAKAINIFRKLSLKYPEKSVYFASRISEIEHNIKNS